MSTVVISRPESDADRVHLSAFLLYFAHLGTFGFGGPIALSAAMRRDLVEARGWITDTEYREGLALAQLALGPLAAQLAIYLGWVRFGVFGATAVAAAFVAPSFLMVLALVAAYTRLGGLPWMQGAFYGIGAVVIAIIARSAQKLVQRTLGRDRLMWLVFGASAIVTAWTVSGTVSKVGRSHEGNGIARCFRKSGCHSRNRLSSRLLRTAQRTCNRRWAPSADQRIGCLPIL